MRPLEHSAQRVCGQESGVDGVEPALVVGAAAAPPRPIAASRAELAVHGYAPFKYRTAALQQASPSVEPCSLLSDLIDHPASLNDTSTQPRRASLPGASLCSFLQWCKRSTLLPGQAWSEAARLAPPRAPGGDEGDLSSGGDSGPSRAARGARPHTETSCMAEQRSRSYRAALGRPSSSSTSSRANTAFREGLSSSAHLRKHPH